MTLIDTHAHLEILENLVEVLDHARAAGVTSIVSVGTSVETSRKAIEIAEKYSSDDLKIYATCGLHPFDSKAEIAEKGMAACVGELSELATTSKKIVAIGETGLDFYGPGGKRAQTVEVEREFQFNLLRSQLKIADSLNLPAVIHCRNAWEDIFEIISKFKIQSSKLRGVFHSFTGGAGEAKRVVELGFYVSFSGIVTFRNAAKVQEAAKIVPDDKILVETDSPFLTPDPFRGQKNESANVKITASFLSNLRKLSDDDFFTQTSKNAQKAFNL